MIESVRGLRLGVRRHGALVVAGGLGQPEVDDLDAIVRRHHDVLGLQIAVHDAGLVRGGQPVGNLLRDLDDALERHPAAQHLAAQRGALDQLRDEVRRVAFDADVVDGDDVGVIEGARGDGLAGEALLTHGIERAGLVEHLDGDGPLEAGVAGAKHLSHPTGAEWTDDLVGAEPRRRCGHGGWGVRCTIRCCSIASSTCHRVHPASRPDASGTITWGAPRRRALMQSCDLPPATCPWPACPSRLNECLATKRADLDTLLGAGLAPFAEVDAGIDAGTLRLGGGLGQRLEAARDRLGGQGWHRRRAAGPPPRLKVRVKGTASVPKNWRSDSAAAPALGRQGAGVIGIRRRDQERAPDRIARRVRIAIVRPADRGDRPPERVGPFPRLVGDEGIGLADVQQREQPCVLPAVEAPAAHDVAGRRCQFEPPPGQNRAMSLSSESGSSAAHARAAEPASPRCTRGHSRRWPGRGWRLVRLRTGARG